MLYIAVQTGFAQSNFWTFLFLLKKKIEGTLRFFVGEKGSPRTGSSGLIALSGRSR